MKRILYLTFYFEPDLCAGSFRNSPLVHKLSEKLAEGGEITVVTTQPNRYSSFKSEAAPFETKGNIKIHRISIPTHNSGFLDQIKSFVTYFRAAKAITKGKQYDMVFASSSRLFTAYLGYTLAKQRKLPLYLDIRDIFVDTIKDVVQQPLIRMALLPVLRFIEQRTFARANHINLISGGFKSYFNKYKRPTYSTFPNGIDDAFLNLPPSVLPANRAVRKIVYAGNMGEGQGLHKIIPQAAQQLGEAYSFIVIGDGGAKGKLEQELKSRQLNNVQLLPPMKREELLQIYADADFLFLHLNDYDAFKKVLPSKIFELGAYDKPIIAGVGGFAADFIRENVPNHILFNPGDVTAMVAQLNSYAYKLEIRNEFKARFRRETINSEMADSILTYL